MQGDCKNCKWCALDVRRRDTFEQIVRQGRGVATMDREGREHARGEGNKKRVGPPAWRRTAHGGRQRTKRRKQGRVLELGAIGKGKAKLIKVVGTIAGVPAVFLVDSGATTEFVDADFVAKAGFLVRASNSSIKLADGSSGRSGGVVKQVEFMLRRTNKDSCGVTWIGDFEVTKLSGYDAILGMSWLSAAKPWVDWGAAADVRLRVRVHDGNGRLLWRALQTLDDTTASAKKSQESVAAAAANKEDDAEKMYETWKRTKGQRDDDDEFIEEERPRSKEEAAVVERLLSQFADVFPKELPAGLPPRRAKMEHRIKLKPHNRAPYRRPYKCGPAELKLVQETIREMEAKGFIQTESIKVRGAGVVRAKEGWQPKDGDRLQGGEQTHGEEWVPVTGPGRAVSDCAGIAVFLEDRFVLGVLSDQDCGGRQGEDGVCDTLRKLRVPGATDGVVQLARNVHGVDELRIREAVGQVRDCVLG